MCLRGGSSSVPPRSALQSLDMLSGCDTQVLLCVRYTGGEEALKGRAKPIDVEVTVLGKTF